MRSVAIAVAISLIATSAGAIYVPDNNGRWVWTQDRSYEKKIKKKKYAKKIVAAKYHQKKTKAAKQMRTKPTPWNMVQARTVQGFLITVHPAHAHKFLRWFEILEQNGVKIPKEMVGCYARANHVSGSNHYLGIACDIQTGWNQTIPELAHGKGDKWAKQAGLYSGCKWSSPDCGHVEAIPGTHNSKKLPPLMAALEKFKTMQSTANYQP